jgi:hypothetical protein
MSLFGQSRKASGIWGQPFLVHSQRTNANNSDVSTADTIKRMQSIARQHASHPNVVGATRHALSRGARSQRDICSAIYYWCRHNIQFSEDESLMYQHLGLSPNLDAELLIPPGTLLAMNPPTGDCDDFCMLIASMLLNCGIQSKFVTVAADNAEPWKYSHVYVCAVLADEGGQSMCLDAGNRLNMIPPGWEPSGVFKKAIWHV